MTMPAVSPFVPWIPTANRKRRHVLDLDDFSAAEIIDVLDAATSMKEVLGRSVPQVPILRGRTVVNVFYEESTRTRMSFELAARTLSASIMSMTAKGSSVEKGESLIDTIRTIQALGADIIVIRHGESGAPYLAAQHFKGSIINAGDGRHAHPSQALLDLFTIRERLGALQGLNVTIVGDILHSRVARSNIWGMLRCGMQVTLCAPSTLIGDVRMWQETFPTLKISYDLDAIIPATDVLMGLRLQKERMHAGLLPTLREYSTYFGISQARIDKLPDHAIVMHPGPMNEGVEIMPEAADSPRSVIEAQVTNGVAVRMALLYRLSGEATI
ncbi:MAG: aspartate carbamoyltransferase catalytic subunit [Chloroflexia bacterium]|nr:aspartate carbamoyltransferase catalytic subunit [Chloroflexia bacterium]